MKKHAWKLGVAVVFCATAISCASDDSSENGGAGGAAGATGGMGGAAGVAGATGGMGGTTGGAGGAMGGAGGMGPTGEPKWSAIFSEVIRPKGCTSGAQCHGGSGGMLMMSDKDTAHAALVGVAAMGTLPNFPNCSESGLMRVKAGDPDNSLLVQKLEGDPACGVQMPPGGPEQLIPAMQLEQIRMWIAMGAENN